MQGFLGVILTIGQYASASAALLLFVYLLNRSSSDPSVNVWLGPLLLIGLSSVFKLTRRGAKPAEKQH